MMLAPELAVFVRALELGSVVACPTETQVGLLADARNAQAIERVQELIGAPIDMVSTGPDRDHTILLRHPYQA